MNYVPLRQRQPRIKDEKHLAFVRQLSCLVCHNPIQTEAAHVRMADPRIGKPMTGIAQKPDDFFVVPLCGEHHRSQHKFGDEGAWWSIMGRDAVTVALHIYAVTGDHGRAEHIVHSAR